MHSKSLLATALIALAGQTAAMDDAALARSVDARLAGDRTGACFAVAVVERDHVARTFRCADGTHAPRIGPDTAFEIGSVSKTMTAALLARLIADGKASLDDPLSAHLPAGAQVPTFQGQPILLRHVVTHTSGLPALPSRLQVADPADPYATLTAEALLASLGDVTLDRAPGAQYAYSNFASMLLSYAIAQHAGRPFEDVLREQVFAPLGMEHAYVARRPQGVRVAEGHLPNGETTFAWTIAGDLAGVGGVRATLDDMVHYTRGQLGLIDMPASTRAALEATQQPVSEQPPMAMHWMRASFGQRRVLMHEGGTGGFSSLVALDPGAARGVVILSDTALTSLGGLGALGAHLLDPSLPPGAPRRAAVPPRELLDGLVGRWRIGPDLQVEIARQGDTLTLHPAGQPVFELGYDDAGDFYPQQFDALLSPKQGSDGRWRFVWRQGGGAVPATRVDDEGRQASAMRLDDAALAAYAGDYTLMPGFVLKVDAADGRLRAQATGQGAFPLDAAGTDRFEAAAFGIVLQFERDADGRVVALDLHQGGRVLRGMRD